MLFYMIEYCWDQAAAGALIFIALPIKSSSLFIFIGASSSTNVQVRILKSTKFFEDVVM